MSFEAKLLILKPRWEIHLVILRHCNQRHMWTPETANKDCDSIALGNPFSGLHLVSVYRTCQSYLSHQCLKELPNQLDLHFQASLARIKVELKVPVILILGRDLNCYLRPRVDQKSIIVQHRWMKCFITRWFQIHLPFFIEHRAFCQITRILLKKWTFFSNPKRISQRKSCPIRSSVIAIRTNCEKFQTILTSLTRFPLVAWGLHQMIYNVPVCSAKLNWLVRFQDCGRCFQRYITFMELFEFLSCPDGPNISLVVEMCDTPLIN